MKKKSSPGRRTTNKRYLVAIPIPSLDRDGAPLARQAREGWTRRTLELLTRCFGGATPVPAPGVNVVTLADGTPATLYEADQTLVLATCSSREEFIAVREQIESFADEMAQGLEQEAVFVLACPSDSFLVEVPRRTRRGEET